jgi:hypothetical protein
MEADRRLIWHGSLTLFERISAYRKADISALSIGSPAFKPNKLAGGRQAQKEFD